MLQITNRFYYWKNNSSTSKKSPIIYFFPAPVRLSRIFPFARDHSKLHVISRIYSIIFHFSAAYSPIICFQNIILFPFPRKWPMPVNLIKSCNERPHKLLTEKDSWILLCMFTFIYLFVFEVGGEEEIFFSFPVAKILNYFAFDYSSVCERERVEIEVLIELARNYRWQVEG